MSVDRRAARLAPPFGTGLAISLLREERFRLLRAWQDPPDDAAGTPGSSMPERACWAAETWLDVEATVLDPWLWEFAEARLGRHLRRHRRRRTRLVAAVDRRRAAAVEELLANRSARWAARGRERVRRRLRDHTAAVLDLVAGTVRDSTPACEQALLRPLVDRLAADRALELLLT